MGSWKLQPTVLEMSQETVIYECKITDNKWFRQAQQFNLLKGVSVTPFSSKVGGSVVKAIRLFETWN